MLIKVDYFRMIQSMVFPLCLNTASMAAMHCYSVNCGHSKSAVALYNEIYISALQETLKMFSISLVTFPTSKRIFTDSCHFMNMCMRFVWKNVNSGSHLVSWIDLKWPLQKLCMGVGQKIRPLHCNLQWSNVLLQKLSAPAGSCGCKEWQL
jgi:hypothetical protein